MVQAFDPYDRLGNRDERSRGGAHQNTSAGSALTTRRMAIAAEIRHIPKVKPRLTVIILTVMCSGNRATEPRMRESKMLTSKAGIQPAKALNAACSNTTRRR